MQEAAKYAGRVDFQRYNIDDPGGRSMGKLIGVSAIPRTCFFDKEGNQVDDLVGGVPQEILDSHIQNLLTHK